MASNALEGVLYQVHNSFVDLDPHITGHAVSGLVCGLVSLLVWMVNQKQRRKAESERNADFDRMHDDLTHALAAIADHKEKSSVVAAVEDPEPEPSAQVSEDELRYWQDRLQSLEEELWHLAMQDRYS